MKRLLLFAALLLQCGMAPLPEPPSVLFPGLYARVELESVFADSKTFADAVPEQSPARIMAEYDSERAKPGFDLGGFVAAHFQQPHQTITPLRTRADESVQDYIYILWGGLVREPDQAPRYSSLLALPWPYLVPGGRFSEIYYWDSYFTMLGLGSIAHDLLARDMIRNTASLIDRFGHVPNGNRSYYLSRSEPPFFAAMVDLVASRDGDQAYLTYLPELQREYDYWMQGAASLAPGQAHRHVVRLADGTLLNRYWDDRDTPRDESYREDVATARASTRPAAALYRDLRAGAETGWDFSSRWLADGVHLDTIRTTAILPVDLNSLIAHMEQTLSHAYALRHDPVRAAAYDARARLRIAAINRLMWQPAAGYYADYVWTEQKPSPVLSAATVLPLFFNLATPEQAHAVAATIRARLLRPGGMATTGNDTGQQWDSPNGWAPLQWMAIMGLRSYGENNLAATIAQRWIARETTSYARSGTLMEKYDIDSSLTAASPAGGRAAAGAAGGHGGEYPLQVGFGWTNGVLVRLMQLYPPAHR